MTYGRETLLRRFTGLETTHKEARNDFSSLEFKNFEILQVGTAKKRAGVIRTVDQTFDGPIISIVPTRNCYFIEQFLYVEMGPTPGIFTGLTPRGCANPDPLLSITLAELANPIAVQVSWVYPKDKCVEGCRIVRRSGAPPTGPEDANADKIIDFQRRTNSFIDLGVVTGVQYFYTGYTFLEK